MADIIDFRSYASSSADETERLRQRVSNLLECDAILADAIDQMDEFAHYDEIITTLRRAIDVLENPTNIDDLI